MTFVGRNPRPIRLVQISCWPSHGVFSDAFVEVLKPRRVDVNGTVTKLTEVAYALYWNDVFRQSATLKGFDVNGAKQATSNIYVS
jgi:hypothetical protein